MDTEKLTDTKIDVTDYEEEVFYKLLTQLPNELARRAIAVIERDEMSDDEASSFLRDKITTRAEAVTETFFSDKEFEAFVAQTTDNFPHHIEVELMNDSTTVIGHGTTARVHELDTQGNFDRIAVKYLIKPDAGTVNANKEHNIVREVERVTTIENKLAATIGTDSRIRVPHPYFYHHTDKMQCYGMQLIDGVNLESAINGVIPEQLYDALRIRNFDSLYVAEIHKDIEQFFEAVHSYCLHGSVKPDNIMIDRNGNFYLVDFGNSQLLAEVKVGDEDWLEAKKKDEVTAAKLAVTQLLNTYKELELSNNQKAA